MDSSIIKEQQNSTSNASCDISVKDSSESLPSLVSESSSGDTLDQSDPAPSSDNPGVIEGYSHPRHPSVSQEVDEKVIEHSEDRIQRMREEAISSVDIKYRRLPTCPPWLRGNLECSLKSEESSKDLPTVQNLIEKHQHDEADVNDHEDCITFFRDSADEESWIKEKKLLVSSDDYGCDVTDVQNLIEQHERLEAELAAHEPTIKAVQEAGQLLVESNLDALKIKFELENLAEDWQELKEMTSDRRNMLNDSLSYHNFLISFANMTEQILRRPYWSRTVEDYGGTMAAVQLTDTASFSPDQSSESSSDHEEC